MTARPIGQVASLHRYPVKSMGGEDLDAVDVADGGLLGDRAYALVDRSSGLVVSAKRPRKWPGLLDCQAGFAESPRIDAPVPPVTVTLPNGVTHSSSDPGGMDRRISEWLGTPVTLTSVAPEEARFQYHWPDMEGLVYEGRAYRNEITEHETPPGTFFDSAEVHVLSTASLGRLRALVPTSDFESLRFRSNIIVETRADQTGFVEEEWVGGTLHVGEAVRLEITRPCIRCVMVSLPQRGLPKDLAVLKAAFDHNHGNVGAKARVIRAGTVRIGDAVSVARPR